MQRFIKNEAIFDFLFEALESTENTLYYKSKNHTIYKQKAEDQQALLRLPLMWKSSQEALTKNNLRHALEPQEGIYLLILMTTGQASLGIFENGENLEHKVIRKYMTRKKQGKSQIKYLKTKGKSRAGSRVRLKNSLLFFEDINTYIQNWYQAYPIDHVFYQVPKLLMHPWFHSDVSLPFKKEDPCLRKLPYNLDTPTFELMKKVGRYVYDAEIIY